MKHLEKHVNITARQFPTRAGGTFAEPLLTILYFKYNSFQFHYKKKSPQKGWQC